MTSVGAEISPVDGVGIAAGPRSRSGSSKAVEASEAAGEDNGERWPEPAVLPDSISKALKARSVDRVREQPNQT